MTPLLIACEKGHADASRLLLEKGAEVDRARGTAVRRCTSPVRRARSMRARLLLDNGAAVDRAEEDGWTPLLIACQNGQSTRRGCCWTTARRSIGRIRTAGRRCTSPAKGHVGAPAVVRKRCGGRSGGEERYDAAVRRLARRAHVEARLLLEKGAEVDRRRRAARRRCSSPAFTATSTRHGCCWTTARGQSGEGGRCKATVPRLPEWLPPTPC